jgi:hypothetical protein
MTPFGFISEFPRPPYLWLVGVRASPVSAVLSLLVSGVVVALVGCRLRALRRAHEPRRLSPEMKAALRGTLGGKFHCSVPVTSRFEDREARIYADDFVEALRVAGCDAILSLEQPLKPETAGVLVVVSSGKPPAEAALLIQALRAARIEFKMSFESAQQGERFAGPDGFALMVGTNTRPARSVRKSRL